MIIPKKLLIVDIILGIIFVFTMVTNFFIVFPNDFYGMGVDSEGFVYVARENRIEVYDNNRTIVREINNKYAGQKMVFTVKDDKMCFLSGAGGELHCSKFDLQGRLLVKGELITVEYDKELTENSKRTVTENGDVYEYNLDKFQYRILLNGETVIYEQPMFHAIMDRMFFIMIFVFIVLAGYTMEKLSKLNNWK